MRSAVRDVLPPKLQRALLKFGRDIAVARKKRRLTVAMMVERVGISAGTYLRAEKGDPTVSLGVYAMILFVLGFGDVFAQLLDGREDEIGLILETERLPQRVRVKQ